MDRTNQPHAFFDSFAAQLTQHANGRSSRSTRKNKAQHQRSSRTGGPDGHFRPLLQGDGLFFRSFPQTARREGFSAESQSPIATIEQAFCDAFTVVWVRIPIQVRQRLLRFWHRHPCPRMRAVPLADVLYFQPFIQLVDAITTPIKNPVCACLGFSLIFPALVEAEHRPFLTFVIAHELAHVYRVATPAYWRLVTRLVGEEECHDSVSDEEDEECDRELTALEKEVIAQDAAETNLLVKQWGFVKPPLKRDIGLQGVLSMHCLASWTDQAEA